MLKHLFHNDYDYKDYIVNFAWCGDYDGPHGNPDFRMVMEPDKVDCIDCLKEAIDVGTRASKRLRELVP